ncbi:aldehyde dehydrogenase family protein [Micromonospora sp. NPDC050417]|uniref:aldehyde dehydrogenase family protein n=1 Tax=Micromonospora sp. NPDC050417 TaxID=3364280 RepID=UPI003790BF4A
MINPADESVVAFAPECSREELDAAVAAARAAAPAWAAVSFEQRQKLLLQMADVVDAHVVELGRLVTAEQGKTLAVATAEVAGLSYWLRETAALTLPEVVNEDSAERLSVTRRVPLGVVAAITPWNYPMGQLSFKLGPALLAGNTVVVKPSAFTPLSTLRLGELLRDLLPAGVVNVVSGSGGLGSWLSGHPGIDKVSFTGSTQTGRAVMAGAAPTLTRITLELGGNDPAIVLPDVDVPGMAEKLFWAAFSNTGQICLAAKRIYIHADIYEELTQALAAYAATVRIGDPRQEGTQLGPISNRRQYETVLDLVEDCRRQGYTFLTGGTPEPGPGFFVPVTLVDNPPEESRIVREEQFGPVLPLLRFDDVDDVVARANAGEYALGASVWSADPDAALAVARRLDAGTVWVNEIMHLTPQVAFGGRKQSGIGVESGHDGLIEFTEAQTITVRHHTAATA